MCEIVQVEDGVECGLDRVCEDGACNGPIACSEDAILLAIASGRGTYTMQCDWPTTISTSARIDVPGDTTGPLVIDGRGWVTLDARDRHRVIQVFEGAEVELRGMTLTGGRNENLIIGGGAALNEGKLILRRVIVRGNSALSAPSAIASGPFALDGTGAFFGDDNTRGVNAELTLDEVTIEDNEGLAVLNGGSMMTVLRSTLSNNGGGVTNWTNLRVADSTLYEPSATAIANDGSLDVTRSTLVASTAVWTESDAETTLSRTIVVGACSGVGAFSVQSGGYNIESPGDQCDFRDPTDLIRVSEDDLALQAFRTYGGATKTVPPALHSVAVDLIPLEACSALAGEETDQRGVPRPQGAGCDVGAVEVVP